MTSTIERVDREVDTQTADRLSDAVRRIFSRVLKELADLENPMRSALGSTAGEGGLLGAEDRDVIAPALGALPPARLTGPLVPDAAATFCRSRLLDS